MLVEWIDTVSDESGWKDIKESKVDVCPTWSIGFLIMRTKYLVVLAATMNDFLDTSERTAIPVKSIRRILRVNG